MLRVMKQKLIVCSSVSIDELIILCSRGDGDDQDLGLLMLMVVCLAV